MLVSLEIQVGGCQGRVRSCIRKSGVEKSVRLSATLSPVLSIGGPLSKTPRTPAQPSTPSLAVLVARWLHMYVPTPFLSRRWRIAAHLVQRAGQPRRPISLPARLFLGKGSALLQTLTPTEPSPDSTTLISPSLSLLPLRTPSRRSTPDSQRTSRRQTTCSLSNTPQLGSALSQPAP